MFRRRFAAALLPRLFGNNVPGHTTRAPPVGLQWCKECKELELESLPGALCDQNRWLGDTERQLVHKRAHAIIFTLSICCLLITGAGSTWSCLRPCFEVFSQARARRRLTKARPKLWRTPNSQECVGSNYLFATMTTNGLLGLRPAQQEKPRACRNRRPLRPGLRELEPACGRPCRQVGPSRVGKDNHDGPSFTLAARSRWLIMNWTSSLAALKSWQRLPSWAALRVKGTTHWLGVCLSHGDSS